MNVDITGARSIAIARLEKRRDIPSVTTILFRTPQPIFVIGNSFCEFEKKVPDWPFHSKVVHERELTKRATVCADKGKISFRS